MTTSFPQSVQARHAELALASYAGWNDPYDEDIRVSPAPARRSGYRPFADHHRGGVPACAAHGGLEPAIPIP